MDVVGKLVGVGKTDCAGLHAAHRCDGLKIGSLVTFPSDAILATPQLEKKDRASLHRIFAGAGDEMLHRLPWAR
jgi:hypothetical protein